MVRYNSFTQDEAKSNEIFDNIHSELEFKEETLVVVFNEKVVEFDYEQVSPKLLGILNMLDCTNGMLRSNSW